MPARTQDPQDLGERRVRVGDRAEHQRGDHSVTGVVIGREPKGVKTRP
jgi:hypothetical protein